MIEVLPNYFLLAISFSSDVVPGNASAKLNFNLTQETTERSLPGISFYIQSPLPPVPFSTHFNFHLKSGFEYGCVRDYFWYHPQPAVWIPPLPIPLRAFNVIMSSTPIRQRSVNRLSYLCLEAYRTLLLDRDADPQHWMTVDPPFSD